MPNKIKSFFYNFDFTGLIPKFRILKEDSYKSIPSTIISIIIIISAITFTIYSIIEFFKFENPSISYIKSYDTEYNKFILLKNTLFMFDASVFCQGNDFIDPFSAEYQESSHTKHLNLERCEIGKNIDIKFRDSLEKEGLKDIIDHYLCISSEHGDLPLYYRPGESP